jgi:hypothetical protein
MGSLGHTATARGRRVHIILRDGTKIVDRFVERTKNKWIVLARHGRVHVRDIRSFSDYKHQSA